MLLLMSLMVGEEQVDHPKGLTCRRRRVANDYESAVGGRVGNEAASSSSAETLTGFSK